MILPNMPLGDFDEIIGEEEGEEEEEDEDDRESNMEDDVDGFNFDNVKYCYPTQFVKLIQYVL